MENAFMTKLFLELLRGFAEALMEEMNKESSYRACGFLEGA